MSSPPPLNQILYQLRPQPSHAVTGVNRPDGKVISGKGDGVSVVPGDGVGVVSGDGLGEDPVACDCWTHPKAKRRNQKKEKKKIR